jgi:hypothetical protein
MRASIATLTARTPGAGRAASHSPAPLGRAGELDHAIGEARDVTRGRDEPTLAVGDDPGQVVVAEGHDRQSRGHVLEYLERAPVEAEPGERGVALDVVGGDADVCEAHHVRHLLVGDRAGEDDTRFE